MTDSRGDPIAREEEPHFACRDGDVAPMLDARPALARNRHFLMMISGIGLGGGAEIDIPGLSVPHAEGGISVPILYMRTTGASGDWRFDPAFDLGTSAASVVPNNLASVMKYAVDSACRCSSSSMAALGDASCETPQWDPHRSPRGGSRQLPVVAQRQGLPRQLSQGTPGSTDSRSRALLTYNVYAGKVRAYKRRNLQARRAASPRSPASIPTCSWASCSTPTPT